MVEESVRSEARPSARRDHRGPGGIPGYLRSAADAHDRRQPVRSTGVRRRSGSGRLAGHRSASPRRVTRPLASASWSGNAVFTGDALFIDDVGVGRCDFPKGDAAALYDSVTKKICTLPDATRVFVGHDYPPAGGAPGRRPPLSATANGRTCSSTSRSQDPSSSSGAPPATGASPRHGSCTPLSRSTSTPAGCPGQVPTGSASSSCRCRHRNPRRGWHGSEASSPRRTASSRMLCRLPIGNGELTCVDEKLAGLGLSPAEAGPSPRPSGPWQMTQFCVKITIPAAGLPFSSAKAPREERHNTAVKIRRECGEVMLTTICTEGAAMGSSRSRVARGSARCAPLQASRRCPIRL